MRRKQRHGWLVLPRRSSQTIWINSTKVTVASIDSRRKLVRMTTDQIEAVLSVGASTIIAGSVVKITRISGNYCALAFPSGNGKKVLRGEVLDRAGV